jgi:hypothetical protein
MACLSTGYVTGVGLLDRRQVVRLPSLSMRSALVLLLALCLSACATYREDLNRGHRLYEEHQYERALAIFRYLEPDIDSLNFKDQARYAYLRGMTDYRLGSEFRADARHWLAIAKAIEQQHPGGLAEQWKQLLEDALSDLNREVYASLGAPEQPPPGDAGQPAAPAPSSGAAPPPPPAPPEPAQAEPARSAEPGQPKPTAPKAPKGCDTNADCPSGHMCYEHQCVRL